jgi:glycosyltransferase involved in cell wall biosynthesis
MKTISWITADCFIDVDLPIIAKLKEDYIIFWQIVIGYNVKIDYKQYVKLLIPDAGKNLTISFVKEPYRHRNPRLLFTTRRMIKQAKTYNPDFYYISGFFAPWGLPLFKIMLPLNKVVMACHNVSTPKGATLPLMAKCNMKFVLHNFNNLQVFSKGQHTILDRKCPGKNVLEAPLALKDYGKPTISKDVKNKSIIRFLNFGIIRDYKRVDLLIEAACQLYERGYNNFRVLIAGSCEEWNTRYAPTIRHPEVFELDIRRIPNENVANLFAQSDYFVMPYQDIAQSGAITVAFQYNVPTIVSDIPQFKEFVEEGETGLFFKSENPTDLADKMQYAIDNHQTLYPVLQKKQSEFVRRELSLDSIIAKYKDYFERL